MEGTKKGKEKKYKIFIVQSFMENLKNTSNSSSLV